MLRRAVRVFMWRRVFRQPWLWLLASGLVLAGIVFSWRDKDYVLTTVFGTVLLAAVLFLAALWRAHFVNTVGKYRRMQPAEAHFTFRDDGIDVASNLGTATLFWPNFLDVWELPDCWLLFTAPNQFVTLPTLDATPELLSFIKARLSAIITRR